MASPDAFFRTAEAPSADAYHTCAICNTSFRRAEHLKRHQRSHGGEKPYACQVCGKSFNRKDSLKRHESKHKPTSDEEASGFCSVRACYGCMKARVRCSRHDPCRRCATRGISCTYPSQSTSGSYLTGDIPASSVTLEPADDEEAVQSSPSVLQPVASTQRHDETAPTEPESAREATFHQPAAREHTLATPIWSTAPGSGSAGPQYHTPEMHTTDQFDVPNVPINWLPYIDMQWDPSLDITNMIQSMNAGPLHTDFGTDHGPWTDPSVGTHSSCLPPDSFDGALTPAGRSAGPSGDSWTSSPMAPQENFRRPGSLYVDGQGSRLTRERIPPAPLVSGDEVYGNSSRPVDFSLVELPNLSASIELKDRWFSLPQQTYAQIMERFHMLCVQPVLPILPSFTSHWFPPPDLLELCTELFFTHFNAYFPVIHKPTFRRGYHSWILILAASAVGCAFAGPTRATIHNTYALAEFLRRALCMEELVSLNERNPMESLMLAQAAMLRCVLENFHSTDKIKGKAALPMSTLGAVGPHLAWLDLSAIRPSSFGSDQSQCWLNWVVEEGRRRVTYGLWIFDTHFKSTSQGTQGSQLSLGNNSAILPEGQDLWNAESEEEWRERSLRRSNPQPLQTVLFDLYMGKCDLAGFDDFTCTILVYAVCQRVYEVGQSVKDVLQNIDPAERTMSEGPESRQIWLPSHATYEKWRNSALDCLDSLHWHSHVLSARQCGLEPPVMNHLHLGRLVLLCPITEIYTLVEVLGTERSISADNKQCEEPLAAIWRWLRQDYYKARLSIIHAGAIFWHVRRYSVRSAFEPNAFFVATLVLWAYSSYVNLVRDPAPSRDSSSHLEIHKTPAQFQIDRPCDDELVQTFIRKGDRMQPCMGGVGCIAFPNAAPKIIESGKALMSSCCSIWSLARRHRKTLSRLLEARSRAGQRAE